MTWSALTLRKVTAIILAEMIQAFCYVETRSVHKGTPLWSLSMTVVQAAQRVVLSDGPGHYTVTIFSKRSCKRAVLLVRRRSYNC